MKTYDMYIKDDYIGMIVCDSVKIESGNEYNRYIFKQGIYTTMIRTKHGIKLTEEKDKI